MSRNQAPTAKDGPGPPFDAAWREATEQVQTAALPTGRVTVSCSATRGVGGLGRHVEEILDALERKGARPAPIVGPDLDRSLAWRRPSWPMLAATGLARALRAAPVPLSHGLRTWAFMVEFDAKAARRLPPGDHLIAFNGMALEQFRTAGRASYESLALVSANSHIGRLVRQHELAHHQYPLEGSWSRHLVGRNLAEYERAQRIYVASRYAAESFLEEGVAEERLARFPLTPDARYSPPSPPPSSDSFEIVYVGRLAVHKGVTLLIDAVRRLPHADMRLRLIGGWATRGMRRFIERACAADRRISVRAGDPLPSLQHASLCVHPAYEDGFAYAPAEALACGVPVIVSEDTGMKELLDPPRTGLVLPTGDIDALTAAIDAAYRRELFVG